MTDTGVMSAEEAVVALVDNPEVRANPYPAYESIRAAGPAFHSDFGFWFVSSYSENARLMRHPELVRQHGNSWEQRGMMTGGTGRPWFEQQGKFMLFLDPPDHTRIRGLVSRAFTPRYLQRLRPQIVERVDELVDAFAGDGGGDLIDRLALPLPMMVICDMLGVPAEDRDSFRAWTVALAATLEPFPSPEVQDRADEAIVAFIDYFKALVNDRRKSPSDDLLSALIEAEQEGERLDEHELILTSVLVLAAGFETTTNLIGNGSLALLCNRDQWERLVEDPSQAPHAVEELLRYDSPVQLATPRVARTSIELEGGVMEEGEIMIPMVGAGNRDPQRFEDPNQLDIQREDVVPLSFGGGPHFCLGASLARIEGAALFEHLPRALPTLKLEEQQARWRPTMNIRGLESLLVTT
ncbi:MAG: cytochrome P450 [Actinomycetota bacterium]|nr:cytochrome P450 [Actinomycetota bacterium]